ncbi:MAG: phosphoheptose isomerase, partial [Sphingomicrobium sp.]
DVTYRLYDYGRPRELHLGQALEVADRGPYPDGLGQQVAEDETRLIADTAHFSLGHSAYDHGASNFFADRRRWVMPLEGRANDAGPGECLLLEPGDHLDSSAARTLIGVEGSAG